MQMAWKTLSSVVSTMTLKQYHANVSMEKNFIFISEHTTVFNLNNLGLKVDAAIMEANEGKPVQGITNSMSFVSGSGSWFPWHPEEMNLGSANYMHPICRKVQAFNGLPQGEKIWLIVAKYHYHIFLRVVEGLLKAANKEVECNNFLLHQFLALDHTILNSFGIDVFWYRQREGDLMITLPNCIHSGKFLSCY